MKSFTSALPRVGAISIVTAAVFAVAFLPTAATVAVTSAPAPTPAVQSDAPHDTALASTQPNVPKATWNANEYDSQAFTTNQPDLNDLPKVHSVYMYPSDKPSRFRTYAAYFQAEQKRTRLIMGSASGMDFRWDERRAADGTGRILHDITVVKAKARASTLGSTKQFGVVGNELAAVGLNDPNTKYFVWLDADSQYCGQGQAPKEQARVVTNAANGTTYSIAYRPDSARPTYDANGGFCNPVTHELLHNLGAVAPWMPNYVTGGHCNDDGNDHVCNASTSTLPFDSGRARTLDGPSVLGGTGNDDYLDANADLALPDGAGKLEWWTINLSRFLCPRSVANRATPDCLRPNEPIY